MVNKPSDTQKRGLIKIAQVVLGFICLLPSSCTTYGCRDEVFWKEVIAFSLFYMLANFVALNFMRVKRYAPLEQKYLLVSALLFLVATICTFNATKTLIATLFGAQMLLHIWDLGVLSAQLAGERDGGDKADDAVDYIVATTKTLSAALCSFLSAQALKRWRVKAFQCVLSVLILALSGVWLAVYVTSGGEESWRYAENRNQLFVLVGIIAALMEQCCLVLCFVCYLFFGSVCATLPQGDYRPVNIELIETIAFFMFVQCALLAYDFILASFFATPLSAGDKKPLIGVISGPPKGADDEKTNEKVAAAC